MNKWDKAKSFVGKNQISSCFSFLEDQIKTTKAHNDFIFLKSRFSKTEKELQFAIENTQREVLTIERNRIIKALLIFISDLANESEGANPPPHKVEQSSLEKKMLEGYDFLYDLSQSKEADWMDHLELNQAEKEKLLYSELGQSIDDLKQLVKSKAQQELKALEKRYKRLSIENRIFRAIGLFTAGYASSTLNFKNYIKESILNIPMEYIPEKEEQGSHDTDLGNDEEEQFDF